MQSVGFLHPWRCLMSGTTTSNVRHQQTWAVCLCYLSEKSFKKPWIELLVAANQAAWRKVRIIFCHPCWLGFRKVNLICTVRKLRTALSRHLKMSHAKNLIHQGKTLQTLGATMCHMFVAGQDGHSDWWSMLLQTQTTVCGVCGETLFTVWFRAIVWRGRADHRCSNQSPGPKAKLRKKWLRNVFLDSSGLRAVA